MPLYEHIFLARQDISAQQVDGLVETFSALVKEGGGNVVKTEYWGLKNLAYKIKKNRKAHFAMLNLDAPPAAVAEMERQMGISTDIIRFLTLRVAKHEEVPSAMMKRGDRGDRDDRRGGRRDRDRDRDGPGRGGGRRDEGASRDHGPREARGARSGERSEED